MNDSGKKEKKTKTSNLHCMLSKQLNDHYFNMIAQMIHLYIQ